MSGRSFAFGPFVLDPGAGTLFRDGELVPIGQKGVRLLAALLSEPGAVRTKAELLDAAWAGASIEESNLSVQVAALRKLLGPMPDGGEWIATVQRIGYRFVGRVDEPPASTALDVNLPSLAVLPFQNLGGDPEEDYFADGVVEDMITALSRFRSFAVIARNSSFVYKGRAVDVRKVAEELGVRYVLEGSVRRSAAELRITAQLIDAKTGAHLWADRYDGAVEHVFDVQDRITESVVAIVEPRIQQAEIERSRRERSGSLAAYDLYLRALPKYTTLLPEDNVEAIALLEQALALEPNYAVALKVASDAHGHRVSMGWPSITPDDRARCIELTGRALAQAAGDATVLAQCGANYIFVAHEYERGMQTLARALEANPNNVEVLICASVAYLHVGSVEDALSYSHRVLRLAPGDPTGHYALTAIAHAHMILGNYAEALAWAERSHALNEGTDASHWMLISANAQLGRMDEARRWLAIFNAMRPGMSVRRIRDAQPHKEPDRMAAILDGLHLAGLAEG